MLGAGVKEITHVIERHQIITSPRRTSTDWIRGRPTTVDTVASAVFSDILGIDDQPREPRQTRPILFHQSLQRVTRRQLCRIGEETKGTAVFLPDVSEIVCDEASRC